MRGSPWCPALLSPLPLLVSTVCGAAAQPQAGTTDVVIAVAANFRPVADVLAAAFQHETPYRVIISSGSSGTLYAQVRNGAPFHAFLSADTLRPAWLERDGLAVRGSRFTYARGQLALWAPHHDLSAIDPHELLANGEFRFLAIAMPATAPYGEAAERFLRSIGQWDRLAKRIVRGESVTQAYQFVASGNADLGLIAYAQVMREDRTHVWLVPADSNALIDQQAVLLEKGRSHAGAIAFLDFLRTETARGVMRRAGYALR